MELRLTKARAVSNLLVLLESTDEYDPLHAVIGGESAVESHDLHGYSNSAC